MKFNIVSTKNFEKEAKHLLKKYASLKKELVELNAQLEVNPEMGTALGKNSFKIRLAISSKGKGKSGGARIITYLYRKGNSLFLLSIFDKSEQENISDEKLQLLIDAVDKEI